MKVKAIQERRWPLTHKGLHVNVNAHLICPIHENIKEVLPLQTSAIPGATPRPLLSKALSQDIAPLKFSYLLAHTSKRGNLEHSRILTQ
jgi:hypothetical protein